MIGLQLDGPALELLLPVNTLVFKLVGGFDSRYPVNLDCDLTGAGEAKTLVHARHKPDTSLRTLTTIKQDNSYNDNKKN